MSSSVDTSSSVDKSSSVVLSAVGVSKSYRDGKNQVSVLSDINLRVMAGDMTAIIGSSGSGKSTLLHILGALDEPDSGEVKVSGELIHRMGVRAQGLFRNKHLGFVYQFHHLLPEFSALENVAMPLFIRGCSKREYQDRAESMLLKVGMGHRLTHKPSELSGGERQRVAIARALVTSPSCVLADEPTGNLDKKNAMAINELMLSLNESENTAFLMVSHDLELAALMKTTWELEEGVLKLVAQ